MPAAKEIVFFTQGKTYCLPSGVTIEELDRKKKRLYGVLSGFSVVPFVFPAGTTEEEIRSHFRQTIDFDSFIVSQKKKGDEILAFAVDEEIARSTFQNYNLSYLIVADIVLMTAYSDILNGEGVSAVGYLDPINGILSYMIIGQGKVHQFMQRINATETEIMTQREITDWAKREIEQIVMIESDRIGSNISYLIAGVNEDYSKITRAVLQVSPKDGLQTLLVNRREILYKKIALSVIGVGIAFDLSLLPRYFYIQRQIGIMNSKIERVNNYIARETTAIKNLYREKGKTIVLQDRIDIAKISRILRDINILPPGRIIYKNKKGDIVIDMYYVNNNILAQKYYFELKKNHHIRVSLYINPTFSTSQIRIVIPKEVIR